MDKKMIEALSEVIMGAMRNEPGVQMVDDTCTCDCDCDCEQEEDTCDCGFCDNDCGNGVSFPGIERAIFNVKKTTSVAERDENGNLIYENGKPKRRTIQLEKPLHTTTLFFSDGTKSIVKAHGDEAKRELGVAYAILKRLFGMPNEDGIVEGIGFSTILEEIAENGWDQQAEAERARKEKERRRAEHIARQKAESQAAHDRLIKRLASELKHWQEAADYLKTHEGIEVSPQLINEVATNRNDSSAPITIKID